MIQITYRVGSGGLVMTSVDVFEDGHPMSDPQERVFSVHDNEMGVIKDYPLGDVVEVIYKP